MTDLYGGLRTDPVAVFSGEGWLPGSALRLWVQSGELRSQPDYEAPAGAELDGPLTEDDDLFAVDALLSCTQAWVEVEGPYSGTRVRGWTSNHCASQVTTCS